MSERDAYINKLQAQLKEWDAEIDKLQAEAKKAEAKGKKAQADVQLQLEEQLSVLRAQRNDAVEKMEELRQAGEGAWHDMKAGMEQAWSRLHDAVNKVIKR